MLLGISECAGERPAADGGGRRVVEGGSSGQTLEDVEEVAHRVVGRRGHGWAPCGSGSATVHGAAVVASAAVVTAAVVTRGDDGGKAPDCASGSPSPVAAVSSSSRSAVNSFSPSAAISSALSARGSSPIFVSSSASRPIGLISSPLPSVVRSRMGRRGSAAATLALASSGLRSAGAARRAVLGGTVGRGASHCTSPRARKRVTSSIAGNTPQPRKNAMSRGVRRPFAASKTAC